MSYNPEGCEASVSDSTGWRSYQCTRRWSVVNESGRRTCKQHANTAWFVDRPAKRVRVVATIIVAVVCDDREVNSKLSKVCETTAYHTGAEVTLDSFTRTGVTNLAELDAAEKGKR